MTNEVPDGVDNSSARSAQPLAFSRRSVMTISAAAAGLALSGATAASGLALISAPSNLGLRSPSEGMLPGASQAPAALEAAGLARAVRARRIERLPAPTYSADQQPGSRILNAPAIRAFNDLLGAEVSRALSSGEFPLVIGGDCSILLGCLVGARVKGEVGLIHVDGHADFFHPANYDERYLRSAAGMDLALATGRGEPILADWGGRRLVADRHAVHIGEREELDADYPYGDIFQTEITTYPVRQLLRRGVSPVVREILEQPTYPKAMWLHVDLDVLDEGVMPAVDSPGRPGLTYQQLTDLARGLLSSGRFIGADITIYDPTLDLDRRHGRNIVRCLGKIFA